VNRRTFLWITASATTAAVGFPNTSTATLDIDFRGDFGYAVASFFDDDGDQAELEDATFEAVHYGCYAYGMVEDLAGSDMPEESGYLDQLVELPSDSDIADWAAENLSSLAYFVEKLGVISDAVVEKIEALSDTVQDGAKYVPLVLSVKGVLDKGCSIHSQVEARKEISKKTYTEFFKRVALVAVEIILLAAGVSLAYKTAFGATGWVNKRLINSVGSHIGWEAYSWLLSQVHWGVRVAFSSGMGQAIDDTVGLVAAEVVSASHMVGDDVSRETAEQEAQNHVEDVANHTDGWGIDYDLWKLNQWVESIRQDINSRSPLSTS